MQYDDNNSPEKKAGIIVFLIFLLIMAAMAILGNHSRTFAKADSIEENNLEDLEEDSETSEDPMACIGSLEEKKTQEDLLIDEIAIAIKNQLIMCRQKTDGQIIYHLFCRKDELCLDSLNEYAKYIVKYSLEFGVDPWLSAAVAMHETHFDAFVRGGKGERSIFQLLPYSEWGKKSHFTQSAKYRQSCKSIVGHCQEESIGLAVELLSNSKKQCKTVNGVLSMYNGGKCQKASTKDYIKGVREKLRALKTNNVNIQWCSGGRI